MLICHHFRANEKAEKARQLEAGTKKDLFQEVADDDDDPMGFGMFGS